MTAPASTMGGPVRILGRNFGLVAPTVTAASQHGDPQPVQVLSSTTTDLEVLMPPGVGDKGQCQVVRSDGVHSNWASLIYPPPHVMSIELVSNTNRSAEIKEDVDRKGSFLHLKCSPQGRISVRVKGVNFGDPTHGRRAVAFGENRVPSQDFDVSAPHIEMIVTVPPGKCFLMCITSNAHAVPADFTDSAALWSRGGTEPALYLQRR